MASARDQELTDRFETFYREYRSDAIADLARGYPREAKSLEIDYEDLFRFDPDFVDDLLETPRRFLDAAEEALRLYDLPVDRDLANAHVRVTNLPDPTEIRDIRSEHLGTLIAVQGIVRKATSVKPKIEQAAFECLRCGTITVVPQADGDFQDPYQCDGCEREGPFQFLTDANETAFVDAQKLRIQESPEGLGGGETPENIDMHIEDDITGRVSPGDHVTAIGILRLDDSDIESTDSRVFDMYLEGVSVTIEDEEFEEMEISETEREEIIRLSEEPDIYERIVDSIAPTIYGFEVAKLAIALQLFSGVTKHLPDGARIRGDIHILLVGDPGTGKSQILQYIRHIAPRSVYTSGKGSSAAGLTAAAVRDDFGDGQQWSLEAGALVLADKGVAAVDELDKMACVTGDTLVSLGNGKIERIGELAREEAAEGSIEHLDNGRIIRNLDGLSVETMTEDGTIDERPVTAIHEYDAPSELCEVTLESGESLTATPDHPFFVWESGERVERPAVDLSPGDWVFVPETSLPVAGDGGSVTSEENAAQNLIAVQSSKVALSAVLGYLSGDGNVYYNQTEGSYGVRFINSEEELLSHFEQVAGLAFDTLPVRHPSEQRKDGVETVRVNGKSAAETVLDAGMNLQTYDGKAFPTSVTEGERAEKAAFVRALADSEGSVDTATGNVKIHSASRELMTGTKEILRQFGITSQIQHRSRTEKRDLFILVITDAESLRNFRTHIGFTLSRKQEALEAVAAAVDGSRTILDVIPDIGDRLEKIRRQLRLYQSECGTSAYGDFERGTANTSIHRAKEILVSFEERKRQAEIDLERLESETSWGELAEIRDRYHVSQSDLGSEIGWSQQSISESWGADKNLKQAVRTGLGDLIDPVSTTDLSWFKSLVEGDVKWRRVKSVSQTSAPQVDDRIPQIRNDLAHTLNCSPKHVEEKAKTLLETDVDLSNWEDIKIALDTFDISQHEIANHVNVDQSTISRWITGAVETSEIERVRTATKLLISQKRQYLERKLGEIAERRSPKVYDLTVEGTHNFVANGMVVHNSDDRSAMHEALEQQSYHPETEILLADGRRVKIGEFVDEQMATREDEIVDGVDCEILPVDGVAVHSTDMESGKTSELPVDRVSRHEAPSEFVQVSFSNDQKITVTPEHPMFVAKGKAVKTIEASEVETGTFVPAPVGELLSGSETVSEVKQSVSDGGESLSQDFSYLQVTDVETVPNEGEYATDWVYDVTVEPTNTFVSQGVILHNSISISKAGINATLKSRCALLGAANPELGRFDRYETPANQIDLEPALVSRFDLIFTVTDKPDEEKDANLAEHILRTNYAGELNTHRTKVNTSNVSASDVDKATESVSPAIEPDIMRKYIAYARSTCFPTMTDAAESRIREFYVDLRSQGTGEDSPVPVTARKLEAIVRLAEASARVRLSDTVEMEDAERALDIVETTLKEIGMDPETGQYDADVIETGQSKTQRDRIRTIKELIVEIESEFDEGAPIDEVLARAEEVDMDRSRAEHEIEKLKTQGEVYEPTTEHLRTT
ncbi:MAG: LAGLIDADG family homing endonuclease [Halodesulfurarchaeum sp.]|nr:LAGLIDADG family homing endonuclease [Halodesulfurarchaeum sp.]